MSAVPYCKEVTRDQERDVIAGITTFDPLPCLDGLVTDVVFVPDEKSPAFVPLRQVPMAGVVATFLNAHNEQADKRSRALIYGDCDTYRVAGHVRTASAFALDFDDGASEDEVIAALDAAGVAYTFYNSHSHGRTETRKTVEQVKAWLRKQDDYDEVTDESLSAYLGSRVTKWVYSRGKRDEEPTHIVCEHAPLVKFRVVIYIGESIPIEGEGGVTWTGFKRLYMHVADRLLGPEIAAKLDKSCSQPGRLFFIPAKPPGVECGHRIIHHNGALYDWRPAWAEIKQQVEDDARQAAERRAERMASGDYRSDLDSVRACLTHIPADDYDVWIRVIAAIHHESGGSDDGHALAHEWSATSDKYDDDAVQRLFESFDGMESDRPATLGTLVHLARESCPEFKLPSPKSYEDQIATLRQRIGYESPPATATPATATPATATPAPSAGPSNDPILTAEASIVDDDDAILATIELLTAAADRAALDVSFDSAKKTFDVAKKWVRGPDGKLVPVMTLLASPIIIDGVGYTDDHKEATLILRIRTETGRWNRIAIPRSELTGGPQLMAKLKGMGLRTSAPSELVTLLSVVEPRRKVVTAKQPGWIGDAFVSPSGEVIGSTDVVPVFDPVKGFDVAGARDEADKMMSAIEHQSRLVFTVTASLAAPLYTRHGIEPGGINLAGKSSGGKTTTLAAALSVWGKGDLESRGGLIGSANTTSFAAEVRAAAVNNLVMSADEIKTAAPETVESLLYTIPNGASRAAGRADGGLREQRRFSVMLLMTGEMAAREYLESNRIAYHAGMAVRILDIPADAGAELGIFDEVPGEFSSAGGFADWIKSQARTNYGHHGRALLESYVADVEGWSAELADASQTVRDALAVDKGDDPQIGRVASRVAFIGAVGCIAARRGIVPWEAESVVSAVSRVFSDWMTLRGGSGSLEVIDAERAFTNFIQTNPGAFDRSVAAVMVDRQRMGVKHWYAGDDGERRPEYWIHGDDALVTMLGGQAERVDPFLKHIRAGRSEDWILKVDGKHLRARPPKSLGLIGRCYCIRSRYAAELDMDEQDAVNDNKTAIPSSRFG